MDWFQLIILVIVTSSGICSARNKLSLEGVMEDDMASLGNTGNDIASKGNTGNDLAPQGNTVNDLASLGNTANDMASLGNTANDMAKDINKKHPRIINGKIVCEKDWWYDNEERMCIKCPARYHTEREGMSNHCWMEGEDIISTPTTSQPTTSQPMTSQPMTTVPISIKKQTASVSTAASIESTTEKNVDRGKVDSTTMVLTQTAGQMGNKDTSTSATAKEETSNWTIPIDIDPKKKENKETVVLILIIVLLLIISVFVYFYFRKWRHCKCSLNNYESEDDSRYGQTTGQENIPLRNALHSGLIQRIRRNTNSQ